MPGYLLRCKSLPLPCRRLTKAAVCILGESVADGNVLGDLELAITEACANVVRHAYAGSPDGDLEIVLTIEPKSHVVVEVSDWGHAFLGAPDVSNPDPASASGRGLYIISRLVDDAERRSEAGKNTFRFRKRIGEDLWKTCA